MLKQSTIQTVVHNLGPGVVGAPTVQISAGGGAFAAPTNSPVQISGPWYSLTLSDADTATIGPLAYDYESIGGTAVDPEPDQVFVDLPGGSVSSVIGGVGGDVTGNVGGHV